MKKLFVILVLFSWGCKPQKMITDTVVKDSVIIREIPRIVEIPGKTIYSPSVDLDSLVKVIQSGVKSETINRTLTLRDPETNLKVGLLIDKLGNISAICEQQEQTITLLEREIERFRAETTNTETIKQPSFWDAVKNMAVVGSWVLIAMAVSFAAGYLRSP